MRLSRTLEDATAQSASNEQHGIKVETRYKTVEGYTYQLTSNPFRAATSSAETAPTMGWTLSTAWSNGRHSEVETFSGASLPSVFGGNNTNSTGKVQTDIDANATTVTDQAGKLRRSITNALGQLTRVDEPNGSNQLGTVSSPNQATSYAYDTLNNLTTVTQGAQTRTFTYSSLSRLLSATNPESGTISYGYDPNGNLTSKVDARSITTTYTYDALNRVTARDYDDTTPDVDYTYGTSAPSVGKLTKVESSVSTTEYTGFDILGRVTSHKQITDGVDYTTSYTYYLNGALNEQTYPSGRVVKNTLDTADGSLSQVQSKRSGETFRTFANGFNYNAAGAVTAMKLGNGRWENTTFNSRLQPTQIGLGAGAYSQSLLKLEYSYGTTANNGNVIEQKITVPGVTHPFVQAYTYDELNRLASAEETQNTSTQIWKQTFTYDRFGNRNFNTSGNNTTTLPQSFDPDIYNPTISTTNNRFDSGQGYSYDSSGNTTADAEGRTFVYDAENKQVEVIESSVTIGEYFYDGDGKRVKKIAGSEETVFVYDAGGKLIGEYSTVVQTGSNAKTVYTTNDHLGSPRINTDGVGAVISRHDYHPFGEEIARTGYGSDTIRKQFTGYERDGETGLDFAQARMYSASHGRFTTVDPLNESAEIPAPQTWNRYCYVLNNPLTLVDPDGEKWEFADEKLKEAFEAAVKAKGRRAWAAYQSIEKNQGVIQVGFGEVGKGGVATTALSGKFDEKGQLTLNGTVTISNDSKVLDNTNITDVAVASGHEFNHILSSLAGKGIPGFSSLAPPTTTTADEDQKGLVDFTVEVASYQTERLTERAMVAKGNKPLTPGTVLERNARAFAALKTPGEQYDYLTSVGYRFKDSRPVDQKKPGPQPANRTNKGATQKRP